MKNPTLGIIGGGYGTFKFLKGFYKNLIIPLAKFFTTGMGAIFLPLMIGGSTKQGDAQREKSDLDTYLNFFNQQIQITYNLKELEMECIEPGLLRELERSFLLQQMCL